MQKSRKAYGMNATYSIQSCGNPKYLVSPCPILDEYRGYGSRVRNFSLPLRKQGKRVSLSVFPNTKERHMRFIIENVRPENFNYVISLLDDDRTFSRVGIKNIQISNEWVKIWISSLERLEEFRQVVSFEFPHFREHEVTIARTLSLVFQDSGLVLSAPDVPGFRFQFV